ncbi:MAG TPA: hypothetical protein VJ826_16430 [Candidatus Polarisedimenticolaceae bacterium]|nr:hypothetical protein [Candidatus Polarisedimenticolaceae bacterium]
MRLHRHILPVLPLLVALPCLAAAPVPPGTGGRRLVIQDEQGITVPPLPRCTVDEGVLHDQLRVVLENEMLWTRMVAVGVLHDLKGHDVYIKRLMANYESFEDALEPFYKEDAASVGRLLEEHIILTSDLFHEIYAGGDFRTILPDWYANGDKIAVTLSNLNPEFWPEDPMKVLWKVYLDDILHGALAFQAEDWTTDVLMLDVFHNDCLAMADVMTTGIVNQCAGPR